jgi:chromosome segregation ATPase
MSKDIALLQDAFTDALSCMSSSQSSLLQQLGNSLCKAIETSIHPVVDNLKQQLHAIQQLNENVKKKERQSDTQSEIRKLQDSVKQLQTEKFETAIQVSKLQAQVESEKMKKESIHSKMQSTLKSLEEDNENLRDKLRHQKSEYEKLMSDYKLLTAKCDSHFEENLSLKSQLSSSFGCFGQKEDAPSDVNATRKNASNAYKETTRKPTALLIGTSNISGIKADKLSQYVEINKATHLMKQQQKLKCVKPNQTLFYYIHLPMTSWNTHQKNA